MTRITQKVSGRWRVSLWIIYCGRRGRRGGFCLWPEWRMKMRMAKDLAVKMAIIMTATLKWQYGDWQWQASDPPMTQDCLILISNALELSIEPLTTRKRGCIIVCFGYLVTLFLMANYSAVFSTADIFANSQLFLFEIKLSPSLAKNKRQSLEQSASILLRVLKTLESQYFNNKKLR